MEGSVSFFSDLLSRALAARQGLEGSPSAYRVVNGLGDGLEGVTLDRYGSHWRLQYFGAHWQPYETELLRAIDDVCAPAFLVVKERLDPAGKALQNPRMRVMRGDPSRSAAVVEEYGRRFHVDMLDTVNPGLFLDMRAIRAHMGELAKGKEMLNLFSYTCSFGVHARCEGATRAVNADVSGKILDKGRANYALNGLACLPGEFFKGDAAEYLDWAVRKERRFGAIVLDPPSFARNKNGVFSVKEHLARLVGQCARILDEGGHLMVSTNASAWTPALLSEVASAACLAAGSKVSVRWRRGQGEDFPGSGQMKESCLSAVLLRKE